MMWCSSFCSFSRRSGSTFLSVGYAQKSHYV
jgi:hypothetical protein